MNIYEGMEMTNNKVFVNNTLNKKMLESMALPLHQVETQ